MTDAKLIEARLRAIIAWLEANQPDVFKHGLWDAINAAAPNAPTMKERK